MCTLRSVNQCYFISAVHFYSSFYSVLKYSFSVLFTHAEISQPSSTKTYGESICLKCCVVWK